MQNIRKKYQKLKNDLRQKMEGKNIAEGDPWTLGNGSYVESIPTSLKNPKDVESGNPIFKQFPEKDKLVEVIRHFNHSNGSIEAIKLKQSK